MEINKKFVLNNIEKNKDEIKKLGVKRIALFGSFAKNKQRKNSDIDIMVKFNQPSFDNYAALLILLEKIMKKKIDLITESSLRPELAYIKKEAEYARV